MNNTADTVADNDKVGKSADLIIDGKSVNYIIAGEPSLPKLIILQGWGTNIAVYMGVVRLLRERYQVFMPEFPGFGGSAEPAVPYSTDDYAAFVLKFMDVTGIDKCGIFAHSHGCRVGFKLLSGVSASRFGKAVFTGAAGIVHKKTVKQKAKIFLYKVGRYALRNNPKKLEEYRSKHGSADYRSASPVMRATLVKLVNEDMRGLMPSIKHPILLIWGTADAETPIADGHIMADLLQNAGLAPIVGAGHYAFLDNCALFDEIMKRFL